jgi:dTDP-4-dehydrorhamnose 3,5-epimerase
MIFEETTLPGVILIKPAKYGDSRGFFMETFRKSVFEEHGIKAGFVQDNFSFSGKYTLRGLHFQRGDAAQAKLVKVFSGEILDVAVDLRKNSPTFGEHIAIHLNDENHHMLYIPEGFAHGFSVLSETASVYYKCNRYYDAESEGGLFWNDPDLKIDWKVTKPLISEKDQKQPKFKDLSDADLF